MNAAVEEPDQEATQPDQGKNNPEDTGSPKVPEGADAAETSEASEPAATPAEQVVSHPPPADKT